tara:strand:+ start:8360 stop:9418 length:1059 start_codon:yes stop_codon:yes gene_type:complete
MLGLPNIPLYRPHKHTHEKAQIMRKLVFLILISAFAWSFYWYQGKSTRQTALTTWFDERNEAGWVADSTVTMRGYPNRLDAIIEGIDLADPISGWAWSAPRFELLQLSYKPNHIIAQWPETQYIKTPYERITINSTDLRASLIREDDNALNRATLTADSLALSSTANWGATTNKMVLAIRKNEASPNTYDLGLDAKDVAPSNLVLRDLGLIGALPATFSTFRADAQITLTAPISQASFENAAAKLQAVTLNEIQAVWGDLALRATGSMDLDAMGYPTGKLTIRATNWEQMLDLAIQSGTVQDSEASAIRTALKFASALTGNASELELPLTFADRKIRLGPIPLGDAPRISFP